MMTITMVTITPAIRRIIETEPPVAGSELGVAAGGRSTAVSARSEVHRSLSTLLLDCHHGCFEGLRHRPGRVGHLGNPVAEVLPGTARRGELLDPPTNGIPTGVAGRRVGIDRRIRRIREELGQCHRSTERLG